MSELHRYGAWIHGALSFGHFVGVLYNLRQKNRFDAAMHTAWFIYDLRAMRHHQQSIK